MKETQRKASSEPESERERMRFLVTGGAGFIGSNTVDQLLHQGHDVVVLDDLSTGKPENLAQVSSRIQLIQDSITNLEAVRQACNAVDCVLHLAAQTSVPRSVKDPIETNQINVDGTLNVLVASRDARVKRVVFASSCAVYGKTSALPIRENSNLTPISPYGISKQVGEAYGRVFQEMYGLEFVALRYFNVFGPRQDPGSPYSGVLSIFNAALLAGTPPTIYGDGEQSRDFVYVQNVVEAILLAAESRGRGGAGDQRRHRKPVHIESDTRGAGERHRPARCGKIRHAARRGHSRFTGGHCLARRVLGYEPAFPFEDGLKRTWEWFSANEGAASGS